MKIESSPVLPESSLLFLENLVDLRGRNVYDGEKEAQGHE